MLPASSRFEAGSIFALLFGAVAMLGIIGVAGMTFLKGPLTTATTVTHQNMADTDLLTNARVVIMNAATLPSFGDADGDNYIEPVAFLPTGTPACTITLPGLGGCLPNDIGAIISDPWGTQYAYCVWDHGATNASANRINGEDDTSGPVIAIISAGANRSFETPCSAYDGDPATNDVVINPDGVGDDLVRIYTYDAAVAGTNGLWQLKDTAPETAVISKNLEVGDVGGGTGFTFDTTTGTGEFPYVKTDFLGSKSGSPVPVEMLDNLSLGGKWLTGDGDNEGIFIDAAGQIGVGTSSPRSKMEINGDLRIIKQGPFLWLSGDPNASGIPATDSVIFHYESAAFGGSNDGMVIEKTDGNGSIPDGGIMFANRGQSGVRNPALVIRGNGEVGIGGIIDPRATLNIDGYENSGTTAAVRIENNTASQIMLIDGNEIDTIGTTPPGLFLNGNSAQDIHMATGGGNVGIGTNSPTTRLQIGENGAADEVIRVQSQGRAGLELNGDIGNTAAESGSPYVRLSVDGDTSVNAIMAMHNQGDTIAPWDTYTGVIGNSLIIANLYQGPNGQGGLQLGTANAARLTILKNGWVGIGTISPNQLLHVNGSVLAIAYNTSSDRRLKTNITPLDGLDIISKLRGVSFTWKKSGKPSAGVIAQEVEKVMPQAVINNSDGFKSVDYNQLIAPLIQAVNELNAKVEKLEAENKELRAQLKR